MSTIKDELKQENNGMFEISGQRMRSKEEQALPAYIRDSMDRARSGFDPATNQPWPQEKCRAYVNAHLPEGDPGRI